MEKDIGKNMCLLGCMQVICEKYKKDWRLLNFACWPFAYNPKRGTDIGNRMELFQLKNINQVLQEYLGFEVEFLETKEINLLEERVFSALEQEKEVVLGFDSFYCKWNPAFGKQHIRHFFIIEEWKESEKEFICHDPFYSTDKKYQLNLEDFKKGAFNVRGIRIKEITSGMEVEQIRTVLQTKVGAWSGKPFEGLKEDFEKVKNLEDIFDTYDPKNCVVFIKIKAYIAFRKEMSRVLQHKTETDIRPEIQEVTKLLEESIKLWEMLQILLLKMLLQKTIKQEYLAGILEMIEKLKKTEQQCFDNLGWFKNRG